MLIGGSWQEVMGCSTIAGAFDSKQWLGWWASGQALGQLGWLKEKDGDKKRPKIDRIESAGKYLEAIKMMDAETYLNSLDMAYRAFSVETKSTASSGTDLHKLLEDYIKLKIEGIDAPPFLVPSEFETQVEKFLIWEKENKVKWIASEVQVGSLMWIYCGIFDFLAEINGKIILGDFKTSSKFKDYWRMQLVGLKAALEEMGQKVDGMMAVRLSRTGDFEVHDVVIDDFEREFLGFIKAKNFLEFRNLWEARQ